MLRKLWRVLRSGDAADVRMAESAGWQGQAYSKLRALLTPQSPAPAHTGAGVPADDAPALAAEQPSPDQASGARASGPGLESRRTAGRGAGRASNARVARVAAVTEVLRALLERFPEPHTRWSVLLVEVRAPETLRLGPEAC